MTIRYFATNRNREKLSRHIDRETRISLHRRGYYFVDMNAYMSHYLATVEDDEMPYSVLVTKPDERIFGDAFLGNKKIGSVVVCVHGYSVDFHEAHTWFDILADTLRSTSALKGKLVTDPSSGRDTKLLKDAKEKTLTALIGFSWPSNGKVLSYWSDQRDAITSAPALANLIARVRDKRPDVRVHLICHSMGNFLACHMFGGLLDEEYSPKEIQFGDPRISRNEEGAAHYFVDRFIMLAADVERRHVTKCVVDAAVGKDEEKATYVGLFYSGLEHLVGEVHNFYSRFDGALQISNYEKKLRKGGVALRDMADKMTLSLIDFLERNPDEKWEQRLGATVQPPNAPPNMFSHNAVTLSGREIGHSDYVDSHLLASRIARTLVDD